MTVTRRELEQLRAAAAEWLLEPCTIITYAETEDGAGGTLRTPVRTATRCSVVPVSLAMGENPRGEQTVAAGQWMLGFEPNVELSTEAVVIVRGRELEVIGEAGDETGAGPVVRRRVWANETGRPPS